MAKSTTEQQQRKNEQIREDLSGILTGEVRTDPGTLALYATDASLHQVVPLAVAFPRSTEDVSLIVRYASEQQIPVIARGSGTGLAGGALGAGIIIDFSRHMNQILEIRERTVIVQPGVILEDLNRALRATGRHFAPDPSNSAITTIGGMIGVDAAGARALRVGSTRDHVKSLQVVLSDGTNHWLQREPVMPGVSPTPSPQAAEDHDQYARVRVILRRLAAILKENEELIRKHQPLLLRNAAGYMLRGILQRGSIDFPRFFVGSEGTLGICTEVVLHTSPLPQAQNTFLLLFSRFDAATQSLPSILKFQPSACDLLDRRLLTLARESSTEYEQLIPPHAEAALIVEFVDAEARSLEQRSQQFRHYLQEQTKGCTIAVQTDRQEEAFQLWQLPRQVIPLLARIKGRARPVPLIEDIVVPPQVLSDFLHQAQRVLQRYQVTASLYAHAGSGQLHLRPFLELPHADVKATYESLARDIYRVVLEHGGSISGEHGDGISRTAFIRTQYGPLYRVFQQIKQLFDPQNIFNPDKIVSNDPHLTIRKLRPDAELVSLQTSSTAENQLQWQSAEIVQAAGLCNGCGQCKAAPESLRMCPFHRIEGTEYTSPRAKANTIRHALQKKFQKVQDQTEHQLSDFSTEEVLSSCFNCKQCQRECPSQVDIPHLWLEAKAADVQENGLNRVDWLLSRVGQIAGLSWRFAWIVNWLFGTKTGRWWLERTCGIDARRKLPPLARKPYLEQTRIHNERKKNAPQTTPPVSTTEEKPVILFLDYYANYHDPQMVQALEAILRHHQIPYHIPLEQDGSGMTFVNVGDLVAARAVAENNIRVLGPYAREGHAILCLEPSSAVCLKQEYPLLLNHPDIRAIADRTCEAGGFLAQLHRQGLLKTDFSAINKMIGYHEPCHQRALTDENPYLSLLPLIPQLKLHYIDKGCSGMAGTFGLSKRNYDRAQAIGAGLLQAVTEDNFQWGASECAACRLQMLQPEQKPIVHPLKILAAAYGLMPLSEGSSNTSEAPVRAESSPS